ncbi:MAG: CHASE2 domain-containing protein [Candidatus Solibacter usitatus]|nr:CHASE2 domain-containing protein [Candidatus Solibacter usitatus]
MPRRIRNGAVYAALAAGAAVVAVAASYTALATQFDNNIYDFIFRLRPAQRGDSGAALVVFDERAFKDHGGISGMRRALSLALEQMAARPPLVTAVDLTLADVSREEDDAALAAAFAKTRNLALGCEMMPDSSGWQDPIERFASHAAALGHVHAMAGAYAYDEINRSVALERVAGRQAARVRRWALSLEAFRLAKGAREIESSPADLMVAGTMIDSRWDNGRPMRVRYRDAAQLPRLSIADVIEGKGLERLKDKVVFVGVTAQSAVRDRLFTPLSRGQSMPGVEIHLQAFDTMASQEFLDDTPLLWPVMLALAAAGASALLFTFTRDWVAYGCAALLLAAVHGSPYWLFGAGLVLPPFGPVAAVWLSVLSCASFRFFFVRRSLDESQAATARYQQAFHFVAHEMRTPLTAIQGSSELMTRYNLPEPKRQELGQMINAESKRLARMITTFLDVEKLEAGQMELRRSDFAVQDLVDACAMRAMPLAERKQIRLTSETAEGLTLTADRELMEYALYNLMTNAVKYSAPETDVVIGGAAADEWVSVSVRDHGMGMEPGEVKNLFRKFYRTRRAEQSGETGTGIGLSIVAQIVALHGGRVDVESAPGEGSTFTLLLPRTIH